MSLTSLWKSQKEELFCISVQAVVGFAGDGKLRDGSKASEEFRSLSASTFLLRIRWGEGSLVHALPSLYWCVGNRSLVHCWLLMFILLPLIGATLAVIFYLVVRGGFFSPQASFSYTSPFGFAALAGLIGMFSQQAVLKLKQVAETLLTEPKEGENPKPQD